MTAIARTPGVVTRILMVLAVTGMAAATTGAPAPAGAAESAWQTHDGVRTRLVSAYESLPAQADAAVPLGWQVDLDDGWKTYWRSPGEAGRPPVLTIEASDNVADLTVQFPLPERFTFYDIETLGYGGTVTLPVLVRAEDPARPLSLTLRADFMICKDVCLLHEGRYALSLPPMGSVYAKSLHVDAVRRSLDAVPDATGDDGAGLSIGAVSLRGPAGNQRLTVPVAASAPLSAADLFVEAAPDFGLDRPRLALDGDGTAGRFVIAVDGGPDKADLAGERITLTLSDGRGRAIERTVVVP